MTNLDHIDEITAAEACFARMESAWNASDGPAFGDEFTVDTDFVDIRGAHHHGKIAVAQGHRALFESIYSGSTIQYRVETVKSIAPDAAMTIASATLDAPIGPLQGVTDSRITAVLTRHGRDWKVAAFHNTLVRSETT